LLGSFGASQEFLLEALKCWGPARIRWDLHQSFGIPRIASPAHPNLHGANRVPLVPVRDLYSPRCHGDFFLELQKGPLLIANPLCIAFALRFSSAAYEMLTPRSCLQLNLDVDTARTRRRKASRMQSMSRRLWGREYRFKPRFLRRQGEQQLTLRSRVRVVIRFELIPREA